MFTVLACLLVAACGGSGGPSGPPTVHNANDNTGGTIMVRPGDTAASIAQRNGISIADLVAANGLQPPYRLSPGQRLFIPNLRLHRVAKGEFISAIAERYGIGYRELASFNGIRPPYTIFPRQILKIPGTRGPRTQVARAPVSAPPPPPARPAFSPPPVHIAKAAPRHTARTAPASGMQQPVAAVKSSGKLIWPVTGRVISGFGPKKGGLHNDGVNILAAAGAPVLAADGGTVVYVGNEVRGFGNLVLIRHASGLTTAYAHLDEMLVEKGQSVDRGTRIATVGRSGGVDVAQLHFEIRKGRKALDPQRAMGPVPVAQTS
ncbi:peptidoglycan DD-metalloendopeptidase family protein [Minwuia sp.]|uniref:peptidoglycan DD-metalloendopeptidase family protein n=1 Tax=Minwuia sp. TaxID=2493630 RepID=UPI003A95DA07